MFMFMYIIYILVVYYMYSSYWHILGWVIEENMMLNGLF